MCNFHKMIRISESTRSINRFDYPVIRFVSSIRYAWSIYLFIFFFARIIFSSKKVTKEALFYRSSRIFRSFPIIFKPRLPFSPDWVRVFVSRPSSSSFFYPTFKLRRRKKEVLELKERSTYVISSRKLLTGPTKEAECAQTKLRFVHAPYEEKIFIQREVYFRCNTIFACYFHVQITSEERKNFYSRQ